VQVAKAWATDVMHTTQTQSDTDSMRPWPSTHTPHRPHVDPPGQLDMRKHVFGKILKSEHGKRTYPARQCYVCTVHKKKCQTRYICEFCVVPLHKGECFQRYHTLKYF
jgi:hypothetical protein